MKENDEGTYDLIWIDGDQGGNKEDRIAKEMIERREGILTFEGGEGIKKLGKQKGRTKGNQMVSKKWKRLVLEVSRRKPLVEANKGVAGIEERKRKVEIICWEEDEEQEGKENWKRSRIENGSSDWMELFEGLEPILNEAPRSE